MSPTAPNEAQGLLSEVEADDALTRVRAFVEGHPRRNESITRRLHNALSMLAFSAEPTREDGACAAEDPITGTDAAVELLDQAAEARIARADGVSARWRLRAARDLGRDAVRALGAGVLVSQEERTSAASPEAHGDATPRKDR